MKKPSQTGHLASAFAVLLFVNLASPAARAAWPWLPGDDGGPLSVELTGGFTGEGEAKAGGASFGDVGSHDLGLAIGREIPLGENDVLTLGLGYDATEFDRESRPAAPRAPVPDRLHSLVFRVGLLHRFDERWSLGGELVPGLHNSGRSFSEEGFGLSGGALVGYAINPRLTLNLGLGFATLSAENELMVFGGMEWVSEGGGWSVAVGFPATAVTRHFSPDFALSLVLDGRGGSYHVEKDPAAGLAGKPALGGATLDHSEVRVGLAAHWRINERLRLTATVGQSLEREFEYDRGGYKVESDDAVFHGSLALAHDF